MSKLSDFKNKKETLTRDEKKRINIITKEERSKVRHKRIRKLKDRAGTLFIAAPIIFLLLGCPMIKAIMSHFGLDNDAAGAAFFSTIGLMFVMGIGLKMSSGLNR